MVKIVKWSQKADRELALMLGYLQNEVSEQSAENLINAVSKKIIQLKMYPEIGRMVLTTKTVRFVNIGKHKRMYYRLTGTTLYIAAFYDNRQNPDNRPY
jgi:plasmid stabilization system protein ParE